MGIDSIFTKISTKALYSYFISVTAHMSLGKNPTFAMFDNIKHIKNRRLKKVMTQIRDEMFTYGTPFCDAFNMYGKGFPPEIISLIRVGETTGTMPAILESCEALLGIRWETEKSIKSEMTYPFILMGMIFLLVVVAIFGFLPTLISLMPMESDTSIFDLYSGILWSFLKFSGLFLAVFLLCKIVKPLRVIADGIKLKLPIIGKIEKSKCTAICALCLEKMMFYRISGLVIYDMMILVAPNQKVKANLRESYESLLEGIPINICLQTTEGFTDLFYSVPIIGGAVSSGGRSPMGICSEAARKDMVSAMKSLVSLIQPIMLVLIAAVIVGVFSSVMLPYLEYMNDFINSI